MVAKPYVPKPDVWMTPLAGLRFYSDLLARKGPDPASDPGERLAAYIAWGEAQDSFTTRESDVLPALESTLGVLVLQDDTVPFRIHATWRNV